MGALEELEATFQSTYASQMASWKSWWDSNTKHGCFCGAGSQCDTAIDALDSCCAGHDDGYSAVGQSADTMWSVDGLIACRHADRDLATCAGSAHTVADNPASNPDPEGYRGHLITLFSFRADVGDHLAALQEKYNQIEQALHGFSQYLQGALSQLGEGDAGAIDTAQQHVAYLQSLECTSDQIERHLAEMGVDIDTVRQSVAI